MVNFQQVQIIMLHYITEEIKFMREAPDTKKRAPGLLKYHFYQIVQEPFYHWSEQLCSKQTPFVQDETAD